MNEQLKNEALGRLRGLLADLEAAGMGEGKLAKELRAGLDPVPQQS